MSSAKTAAVPDRIVARVAGAAVLVSLFAFLYYLQRSDLLLYGDAVAHINIARRVFDSQTPGLLQLGTVWLPLPHLLMIPFIFSDAMWQSGAGGSIPSMIAYVLGVVGIFRDAMWQSGAGGSIPSMIAYVLGVVGIFRLVRGMLETNSRTKPAAVMSACAAAFAYGANPNLIYMQATAMTESIYLTLFVWAVVYFAEFIRALNANPVGANQLSPALQRGVRREDPSKSRRDDPVPTHILMRCACCLAGAELTRYDGWFLAGVMGAAVVDIVLRQWQNRALRRAGAKFLLGIAVAPLLWLAYNRVVYGNALEFANGPYSAKAIEQRVGAPNPALHNARVAAIYYLKSGQLNMAEGNWGRFWLAAAVVALAIGVPHVVAVCHLQPALRTSVAPNVCGFDWIADRFNLSGPREWAAWGKTGAGDLCVCRAQLCVGVEGGASMPEGSPAELGDPEYLEFRGGAGNWSVTAELTISDGTGRTCRRHAAGGHSTASGGE